MRQGIERSPSVHRRRTLRTRRRTRLSGYRTRECGGRVRRGSSLPSPPLRPRRYAPAPPRGPDPTGVAAPLGMSPSVDRFRFFPSGGARRRGPVCGGLHGSCPSARGGRRRTGRGEDPAPPSSSAREGVEAAGRRARPRVVPAPAERSGPAGFPAGPSWPIPVADGRPSLMSPGCLPPRGRVPGACGHPGPCAGRRGVGRATTGPETRVRVPRTLAPPRAWGSRPTVDAGKKTAPGAPEKRRRQGDSSPCLSQLIAHRGACGKAPVVPQNHRPRPQPAGMGARRA